MKNKIEIITFSGVDGAGKTTILRKFTRLLQTKYHKNVIELRHRPSILPILSAFKYGKKKAELKTMEILPRTGGNSSKLSSYVRFFYYLLDYIIGQWVIYLKYTRKGIVVIYDRYYFDFINDALRTNICLDASLMRFFYKYVFKPDINIFLFAPPEVILNRKKEMDKEAIISLTNKYQELFSELGSTYKEKYISIENLDIEVTINTVENIYIRQSS